MSETCPKCGAAMYCSAAANAASTDDVWFECRSATCDYGVSLTARLAHLNELANVAYEQAPSLRDEGPQNFDGHFCHFNEVLSELGKAWPQGKMPGYSQSPWELLTAILNDRDELRTDLAALKAIVEKLVAAGKEHQAALTAYSAVLDRQPEPRTNYANEAWRKEEVEARTRLGAAEKSIVKIAREAADLSAEASAKAEQAKAAEAEKGEGQ